MQITSFMCRLSGIPRRYNRWRLFTTLCRSQEVQGKKTITLFNKVDVGAAIRMRDSNGRPYF